MSTNAPEWNFRYSHAADLMQGLSATPMIAQRSPHSASSSVSLSSTLLDDQDEDVQIAVRALGDMRNGGVSKTSLDVPYTRSEASTSSPRMSSSLSTTSLPVDEGSAATSTDFASRVAQLPLVHGALRMYEQGKASSKVVKYGAEIMESSMKTISRPVIDRLPSNAVDGILDRISRPRHSPISPRSPDAQRRHSEADGHLGDATSSHHHEEYPIRRPPYDVGTWIYRTSPYNHPLPDDLRRGRSISQSDASSIEGPSTSSRSITPTLSMSMSDRDNGGSSRTATSSSISGPSSSSVVRRRSSSQIQDERSAHSPPQERERQLTSTSRLGALLTQASGLGMALSPESIKRLRYCLTWLHWAIDHIDYQITFLRDFTSSLQQQYPETVNEEGDGISPTTPTQLSTSRPSRRRHHPRTPSTASISEEHQRKLNDVRKDVVQTIRQVVSIVSKHAGEAALPEPTKKSVKSLILKLPRRWAEAVRVSPSASGAISSCSGPSEAERESVNAAASGRAISGRRHHGSRLRERGVSSAAASPASSRAASPAASPRLPLRGIHEGGGGSSANDGSRTMSASSAIATTQGVLTLATESLDMMKNVTRVVKKSLDAADQWLEKMRRYGMQGGSQADGEIPMDDWPPPHEGSRSHFSNGEYQKYYEYRDGDALSPLNLSRRGSMEGLLPPPDSPYSTQSTLAGGSTPGTPGFTALKVPYSQPVNTLSHDVRGSMRQMSLIDGDMAKREDVNENVMEMDLDADT